MCAVECIVVIVQSCIKYNIVNGFVLPLDIGLYEPRVALEIKLCPIFIGPFGPILIMIVAAYQLAANTAFHQMFCVNLVI